MNSRVRTSLGELLRRRDRNNSAVVAKLAAIQKELTKLRHEVSAKEDVRVEIPDPEFLAASREVLGHGRTMLGRDRLWILWQAARNVAPLERAAAEVGTYRGGSAYFIAAVAATLNSRPRKTLDWKTPAEKLNEYLLSSQQPSVATTG